MTTRPGWRGMRRAAERAASLCSWEEACPFGVLATSSVLEGPSAIGGTKTQSNIALTSGEADLNSAVKSVLEVVLVLHALSELFPEDQGVILSVSASACKGILLRSGKGKVKHLSIKQLGLKCRKCRAPSTPPTFWLMQWGSQISGRPCVGLPSCHLFIDLTWKIQRLPRSPRVGPPSLCASSRSRMPLVPSSIGCLCEPRWLQAWGDSQRASLLLECVL